MAAKVDRPASVQSGDGFRPERGGRLAFAARAAVEDAMPGRLFDGAFRGNGLPEDEMRFAWRRGLMWWSAASRLKGGCGQD
jgi:hypothetical protein